MAMADPGWDLYRTFLAVVQERSLSGAARALGLTQPTVGRHIDALEQALGFQLFTRSQHGLAPTEGAQELRPYAEALAATAASLLRAASAPGDTVRGTVRITSSEVVGAEVLPPILTALREQHPRLVIELVLSNVMEDLLRRDADIAVRMAKPTQGALLAKHLGIIEVGLHAHRRYLEMHGTPARLEELERHALIGFDKETAPIRSMAKRVGGLSRASFTLRANSDLAQLAAIRAAYGIGFCQVRVAERDGDLVRVLPQAVSLTLDTWLAMHEDLRTSRRCRVVFDALADGLARYIKGT
jgi:DNA-binding transcriptional LysR family regulator